MPTTEAAGVRLVVHEQDDEPFPDTFGYSAPTGFVSSFGLKTKVLHRLGWPYGKCVEAFRPVDYIYEEHYSPEGKNGGGTQTIPAISTKAISLEGCFRNCFQHIVLRECGCGDPRFPLPPGRRACDAVDPVERRCLTNITLALGGFHHS
uniref:Uncharacterized protein n=1 Tax=Plectus sambesii TaxID=2011161 RepID=A0A914WQ79_9BILA